MDELDVGGSPVASATARRVRHIASAEVLIELQLRYPSHRTFHALTRAQAVDLAAQLAVAAMPTEEDL